MGLEEYDIGRVAGKGKFSVVYRAKRKRDNKTVALKKINVDVMDKGELDQCLKEVEMLQAVTDHPNIISYLDSFLEDEHLISKFVFVSIRPLIFQCQGA